MLKLKKFDLVTLKLSDARALGPNLIAGKFPEIEALGNEEVTCEIEKDFTLQHLRLLTDDNNIVRHFDLRGTPCRLTYDIGKITDVDRIDIGAFPEGKGNFLLSDFEIYASDDRENLYDNSSLVYKYYRAANEPIKGRDLPIRSGDFIFDVEGSCRYFGLQLNAACPSDEIARIRRVALFNDYTTVTTNVPFQYRAVDIFDGMLPEILGDFAGDTTKLTDKKICEESGFVTALSDIGIIFKNSAKISVDTLYIVGKNACPSEIISDGKSEKFSVCESEIYGDNTVYKCEVDDIFADVFEVKFKKGATVELVFCNTHRRMGYVDFTDITDKNFLGAGGDVVPTNFTEFGRGRGYNDVYFELEKHHIQKAKPHAVRMWFQIDWMVQTHEQYLNGEWLFDTDEMRSVKRFCQAYKDENVEIEFNFGWKIGTKIQDWFCIAGIPENMKRNAAPADIYNFAKACAAVLEHLILDCGFTNIKYLTFYNEPQKFINWPRSDFNCMGDSFCYMASLVRYADYFIKNSRVSGLVDIWAIEENVYHGEVMQKMNILIPDLFTTHTIHRYLLSYDQSCDFYDNEIVPNNDGKPVVLTEYGNSYREFISFDTNHIATLMAGATHGVSGAFLWLLHGAPLIDPLNWVHADKDSNKLYQSWTFFPMADTLEDSGESFYELSLTNNYVPNHSIAYMSGGQYKYNDFRVNGFTYNGDYTICVESKGTAVTDITVDLGRSVGKTFYRHTYRHTKSGEGNLIIPPVDKVMNVDDTISDTITEDYSFTVYTTIKPVRQVIMDKVDVRMKPGETLKFGATVIDGDEGAKPTFEISASLCDGAKYENGEIIVPKTAKKGDMFALKASLPTGEYGVSIIRIFE